MKKTVYLTESELHQIISESVQRLVTEQRMLNEYIGEELNEGVDEDNIFTGMRRMFNTASKGDVREAYAILAVYIQQNGGNQQAINDLQIIANAINTLLKPNKQLNYNDAVGSDDGNPQSVKSAAGNLALDAGLGTIGLKTGSNVAAKTALTTAGKIGAGAALKGAGAAALGALAGPIGWAWLAADVVAGAYKVVQACKNAKDPLRAPRMAIETIARFFNSRGKKANNPQVQQAIRNLQQMIYSAIQRQQYTKMQQEYQKKMAKQGIPAYNGYGNYNNMQGYQQQPNYAYNYGYNNAYGNYQNNGMGYNNGYYMPNMQQMYSSFVPMMNNMMSQFMPNAQQG